MACTLRQWVGLSEGGCYNARIDLTAHVDPLLRTTNLIKRLNSSIETYTRNVALAGWSDGLALDERGIARRFDVASSGARSS